MEFALVQSIKSGDEFIAEVYSKFVYLVSGSKKLDMTDFNNEYEVIVKYEPFRFKNQEGFNILSDIAMKLLTPLTGSINLVTSYNGQEYKLVISLEIIRGIRSGIVIDSNEITLDLPRITFQHYSLTSEIADTQSILSKISDYSILVNNVMWKLKSMLKLAYLYRNYEISSGQFKNLLRSLDTNNCYDTLRILVYQMIKDSESIPEAILTEIEKHIY